jgi:MFS family permease
MVSTFLPFGSLFTSALLFVMGGGVMNTQLSLRMAQEGFSTLLIGITMACYFLGLVAGYFLCHRLIHRVGHVRSFAVFAADSTAIVILHGFYISAIFWAILRFFNGVTVFGLFMIVESWLNECSQPQTRGRVFSIYKEKVSMIPVDEQVNFIAMKNTSSVAMVMDPRTDIKDGQSPR